MKYTKYSVVIIGSGIAGLYASLKITANSKLKDGLLIVTKSRLNESNSRYAQGGIVGVIPENKADSVSLHVSDTVKSGCGLSDFNVVKFISENSDKVIKDLLKTGVNFDKKGLGLSFTMEGAHSVARILHSGGDATGKNIEKTLCEKIQKSRDIDVYEGAFAAELLIDKERVCRGLVVYNTNTNEYEAIYASVIIIATGGLGQAYKYTTNPKVATGDGIALAKRAGAKLNHMEFVQFHPTALALDNDENRFLISEAVRGEGAKLLNINKEYFALDYDSRGELAPRDIVTRANFDQMAKTASNCVLLDARMIKNPEKRFPNIVKACKDSGIDFSKDYIPVAPAAHYTMGGIKTDLSGRTSLSGLYAIGEAANTGLHGANRLASNSLLECVVCAYELAKSLKGTFFEVRDIIDESIKQTIEAYDTDIMPEDIDIEKLISELRETMWENVGIIRNYETLMRAKADILKIEEVFPYFDKCPDVRSYELRNLIEVSKSVIDAAIDRKHSVGAHFRDDEIIQNPVTYKAVKEEKTNGEITTSKIYD